MVSFRMDGILVSFKLPFLLVICSDALTVDLLRTLGSLFVER